jgi:hypothetical protein
MARGHEWPTLPITVEGSPTHVTSNSVPRCGACGDVIGVYEPLVRVLDGSVRHTSRAADPVLPYAGERWFHGGCYESLDLDG